MDIFFTISSQKILYFYVFRIYLKINLFFLTNLVFFKFIFLFEKDEIINIYQTNENENKLSRVVVVVWIIWIGISDISR